MTVPQFLDTDAAFALRVKQLQDRLYDQMGDALMQCGLAIPSKTTGIIQLLHSEGPCSLAQIADRLRYSHQLATQRLSWLLNNKMALSTIDTNDRRKRLVKLTKAGTQEAKKLQVFLPMLHASYTNLFKEIDIDLNAAIVSADIALQSRSLVERFPEHAVTNKKTINGKSKE